MKKIITAILFTVLTATAAAQSGGEESTGFHYIPLAAYEYLSLGDQSVHSPGGGLAVQSEDTLIVGMYSSHMFNLPFQHDVPELYHSVTGLYDTQKGNHNILVIFSSDSDMPVAGGLNTYSAGAAYGYRFFNKRHFSMTAGGGVAVTDAGVDLPDGKPWPLFPVPLVRISSEFDLVHTSFEFLTGPNLNITIAPKNRVRLISEMRMDEFRDARDIIFDCALAYRFFNSDHEYGDFAGLSAGIKGDSYNFDCSEGDEKTGIQYYAVYGKVDITLLQISAGCTFSAVERFGDKEIRKLGDGYFVAVQGLYQF